MGEATKQIVIVGGGFAGIAAARGLRRAKARVTLVDRRNYHLFQPLLYQVATAALSPSDIAAPIRSVLRKQANCEVLLADVRAVDVAQRRLVLDTGELRYDELIVATGATHSYFGHDEWAPAAPGLKSIEDALEIRRRVLFAYEAAERETDPEKRAAWLTFVIVGAGPTGSELAGALAEIARYALPRDFRHIDTASARVLLVEGAPRVLPVYVESLSEKAKQSLEGLGVEVRTGVKVTHIDRTGVSLGDEKIAARTVLWAAGVQASPLARSLAVPLDRAGRVLVERDLTIPDHPEVQVIGDLAALEQDGKPVFGVAPAALQAGKHAAKNVLLALEGRPKAPFRYLDKGSLATIGRKRAVAQIGKLRLSGGVAWFAWLFIHILFLIGFRNRALVLFQWAWSYLTYQRGARLITGDVTDLVAPPLPTPTPTPESPAAARR
jgi:NADH dehydrogenase